ncbi:hypothetical protein DFH09DRAFT_1408762 [Mycena vulgaris]|nr:hypothetical protein DFH09DRAFT_1408762 [Mycena vulgaris]
MSSEVPLFAGELGGSGIGSTAFIKKFRAHMRNLGTVTERTDAQKIEAFSDYLMGPAEKWFDKLQASPTAAATWVALEAAFRARFPGPVEIENDPEDWERILLDMRLSLEEVGTEVNVGGILVHAHVHFATKLVEVATLAGIASTPASVWIARKNLPEVLRTRVGEKHASWIAFADAIKALNKTTLAEAAVKARRQEGMERTVESLRVAAVVPLTPVSKTAAQLARASIATPRAAATPAATAAADPFEDKGGRGKEVLPPSETVVKNLREMVVRMSAAMFTDDASGRAAYAKQVKIWDDTHGLKNKVWLERTGYPLSPATSPPNSGECFGCGKKTMPWHKRADCPGPAIPAKETTFRAICAKYLKEPVGINVVQVVRGDLDWMTAHLVDDNEEEDFVGGSST